MEKIFSIAIDGPAGAGKSTIARAVADRLGAMYLDTGAMYRAVGLYFMRRGLDEDAKAVASGVKDVQIAVKPENGKQRMYLDGEDVTEAIRTPEASLAASHVADEHIVIDRMMEATRIYAHAIAELASGNIT